jgi:hypothetical protein
MKQRKKELQQLDKFDRWLVVTYWRWLLIKQTYKRRSLPMRLVPIQAAFGLALLLSFPRQYPMFMFATVVFTASYYIALILLTIPKCQVEEPG